MGIKWTEAQLVGIEIIDKQHKELFLRIDAFVDALGAGKGMEELSGLADFLEKYTEEHFHSEEEFMRRYDYPSMTLHTSAHNSFRNIVKKLKGSVESGNLKRTDSIKTGAMLGEWWVGHINKVDRELGSYLKPLML